MNNLFSVILIAFISKPLKAFISFINHKIIGQLNENYAISSIHRKHKLMQPKIPKTVF